MTVGLIMFVVGVVGLGWAWHNRPDDRRTVLAVVAVGGLGFQLVHALEHVVQLGAWVAAPDQPPFVTPWAGAGRDLLAVGGDVALGNELLHLGGNLVFLVGLVAFAVVAWPVTSNRRWLRLGLVVQGAHVVEHMALAASAAIVGKALGATTLFGQLEPGPVLWTLRVTAHFGLNAVATVAAGVAVGVVLRDGGRPARALGTPAPASSLTPDP